MSTTVVGLLLVAICIGSAGNLLLDAEQGRPNEETASVESIVFIEQGERASIPQVTAFFEHDGQQFEAVFVDADERLAAGDQFTIKFDPDKPFNAVPAWQADTDRENQRLLAFWLLAAAVLAMVLVRTERHVSEQQPLAEPQRGALTT